MLNVMRRSANTWVIKLLLIFIALSFTIWGVGDYVNKENQMPVAEADGWAIYSREFAVAYDNEFNRMRERFGGSLDKKTAEVLGLKQRTLNALINRHLILSAGRQLRLTVSPDGLRHSIAGNKVFSTNGQFDSERYRLLLRNNRLTPREFEGQLVDDIIADQIQQVVGTAIGLPDVLVADTYRLKNEKRVVTTLTLKPQTLESDIKPTEEELASFLKAHIDRFMTTAQVKVHYVVLNADSVRDSVAVTEEEIQKFYEENLGEFKREEKRKVRHILVKTGSGVSESQALTKINQAKKRLDSGDSFQMVAKDVSEDVSAAQGGDLGEFGRGMMVKPFEKVAFSLGVGKVSKPVKTQFGYHLILVDAIVSGEIKSVEQVSAEIKGRIVQNKAVDLVYDRSITLEDQLFASGDLKAISGDLNLRYKETDWMKREDASKYKDIERESKFMDAAFSTVKGELSPLVELANGQFFALQVVEKKNPAPKVLEVVREEVTQAYKKDKADDQARELLDKALKMLVDGKSWEEAIKVHKSLVSGTSKPFTRDGGKGSPSPAIRSAAFKLSLKNALHANVIEGQPELTLVKLSEIQPADPKGLEKASKTLAPKLKETLGREQVSAFLSGLRQQAGIKINQEVLDRF